MKMRNKNAMTCNPLCFSLVAALFYVPYRLPAAVVVEDILTGSVEHGKYVENPLGHLAAKYSIKMCVVKICFPA
jgi:hypothetical protein